MICYTEPNPQMRDPIPRVPPWHVLGPDFRAVFRPANDWPQTTQWSCRLLLLLRASKVDDS
jgi:hypothetical protein